MNIKSSEFAKILFNFHEYDKGWVSFYADYKDRTIYLTVASYELRNTWENRKYFDLDLNCIDEYNIRLDTDDEKVWIDFEEEA